MHHMICLLYSLLHIVNYIFCVQGGGGPHSPSPGWRFPCGGPDFPEGGWHFTFGGASTIAVHNISDLVCH